MRNYWCGMALALVLGLGRGDAQQDYAVTVTRGIDGIYPSTESNIYGNNVTQLSIFLHHGAKRCWLDPEKPLPAGKLKAFYFYVNNSNAEQGMRALLLQIWRPTSVINRYQLVWQKSISFSLPGNDGGFVTVRLEDGEEFETKASDFIGWKFLTEINFIPFDYTESHKTLFTDPTKQQALVPEVSQIYQFDNIYLPSVWAVAVKVDRTTTTATPQATTTAPTTTSTTPAAITTLPTTTSTTPAAVTTVPTTTSTTPPEITTLPTTTSTTPPEITTVPTTTTSTTPAAITTVPTTITTTPPEITTLPTTTSTTPAALTTVPTIISSTTCKTTTATARPASSITTTTTAMVNDHSKSMNDDHVELTDNIYKTGFFISLSICLVLFAITIGLTVACLRSRRRMRSNKGDAEVVYFDIKNPI